MKERVIKVLKSLDIKELREIDELWELPGSYVNMESKLLDGSMGKVLDDEKIYLCCQIEINEEECYGVAADESKIVIYRYKNEGEDSVIVKILEL